MIILYLHFFLLASVYHLFQSWSTEPQKAWWLSRAFLPQTIIEKALFRLGNRRRRGPINSYFPRCFNVSASIEESHFITRPG